MNNNCAGLYIHVPFCITKCFYCSFYSVESTELMPQFLAALSQEMEYYRSQFNSFDTIYIGGGTPSLVSISQLEDIFNAIDKCFTIDPHAEITIEINPGDVSTEYFRGLREIGINRLNIGIQSFDKRILKLLGRRHTDEDVIVAMDSSRKTGFDNIGIDLIYGLHGQDMKLWKQTLQKGLSFSPEHLSCYQLSLEKNTPLARQYKKHGLHLPSENEALRLFMKTSSMLNSAGYIHYEVSNFARHGSLKSRHNTKYWQHAPYLGLGPAAHSFLNNKRWWNKSSVRDYLQAIACGKMPVEDAEILSPSQLKLEALFLGLRTKAGINLELYRANYGIDLLIEKKEIIESLINNRLVELKDGFLRPTLAGMAVADSLALI